MSACFHRQSLWPCSEQKACKTAQHNNSFMSPDVRDILRVQTLFCPYDLFFVTINLLFYPQFAYYPRSAVCSLYFTPGLLVCSLQSAFYTDRFLVGGNLTEEIVLFSR